jgi:hypothetical protein
VAVVTQKAKVRLFDYYLKCEQLFAYFSIIYLTFVVLTSSSVVRKQARVVAVALASIWKK